MKIKGLCGLYIKTTLVLRFNWNPIYKKGISNIRFYNICSLPGIAKVRKLRQYENIVLTPTLKEIKILTEEPDFGWLSPCGQAKGGSIFANELLDFLLRLETQGQGWLCDRNRWPTEWRCGYQRISHHLLNQHMKTVALGHHQSPISQSKLEILGKPPIFFTDPPSFQLLLGS